MLTPQPGGAMSSRKRAKATTATKARSAPPGEKILERISSAFDTLPGEVRKAARHVIHNHSEVAFRSMRSVAKSADVSPATMVRLAKTLGFEGYEQLRTAFQEQIETRPQSFLARAEMVRAAQSRSRWMDGVRRVIDGELANIRACVGGISERDLDAVARLFAKARRVFVLGLRGM